MKNFEKRLKEAKSYIHYAVKEGYLDEADIKEMTDRELIYFAEKEQARAEAYYDHLREVKI